MTRDITAELVPITNAYVIVPTVTASAYTYCNGLDPDDEGPLEPNPYNFGNLIIFTTPTPSGATIPEGYYNGRALTVSNCNPDFSGTPDNTGSYTITTHTIVADKTHLIVNRQFFSTDDTNLSEPITFTLDINNYTALSIELGLISTYLNKAMTLDEFDPLEKQYLSYKTEWNSTEDIDGGTDLQPKDLDHFFRQYPVFIELIKGYSNMFDDTFEGMIEHIFNEFMLNTFLPDVSTTVYYTSGPVPIFYNKLLNFVNYVFGVHPDWTITNEILSINEGIEEFINITTPLKLPHEITQMYIDGKNWGIYYDALDTDVQFQIDGNNRSDGLVLGGYIFYVDSDPIPDPDNPPLDGHPGEFLSGVTQYNVVKQAELDAALNKNIYTP